MSYLQRVENKTVAYTHKITIRATLKRERYKGDELPFNKLTWRQKMIFFSMRSRLLRNHSIRELIKNKAEERDELSLRSIDFKGDIIEIVIYVSKPGILSEGVVFTPKYPSRTTKGMDIAYLIRSSKAIEGETSLYFSSMFKFPEGIGIKEGMPEIEVEQILFPEEGDGFTVQYETRQQFV
ncbi:MAG: hypothetical protein KAI71_02805 [Candidatus Pacebacteria bacterium]|nr:hypothetical protein [Candidatus Paceibacterota bacterium]